MPEMDIINYSNEMEFRDQFNSFEEILDNHDDSHESNMLMYYKLNELRTILKNKKEIIEVLSMNNPISNNNDIIKYDKIFITYRFFAMFVNFSFNLVNLYAMFRFINKASTYSWYPIYIVFNIISFSINIDLIINNYAIYRYVRARGIRIGQSINSKDIPIINSKNYNRWRIINGILIFLNFSISFFVIYNSFNLPKCEKGDEFICSLVKFIGYYTLACYIIIYLFLTIDFLYKKICKSDNNVNDIERNNNNNEVDMRIQALNSLEFRIKKIVENIRKEIISKKKNKKYTLEGEEELICSICTFQESDKEGDYFIEICDNGHKIHINCILDYIECKENPKCPNCRGKIKI